MSAHAKNTTEDASGTAAGMPAALGALMKGAVEFVAKSRLDDVMRGWLGGLNANDPGAVGLGVVVDAMAKALELALFTPSSSGMMAFDRFARHRGRMDGDEAAALQTLRRSAFRLLQIEDGSAGEVAMRDLVTGDTVRVASRLDGRRFEGVRVGVMLGPLDDGRFTMVGPPTPLDDSGVAVGQAFANLGTRPGKGGALPLRCAEAVYRHVVRHGTPIVPGLNDGLDGLDDGQDEWSELDALAADWDRPGMPRDEADLQVIRNNSGLNDIIDVICSIVNTRRAGVGELSAVYRDILRIQLETVHRRRAAGSVLPGLDEVAAELQRATGVGELPPDAFGVFTEARASLASTQSRAAGADPELDRLIGRIQGLRAKTVEQGCTEQEALAAAAKVAELLDRYGLSLSEMDLEQQSCEGHAVETTRKRVGPIDECVPTIGAFCDCRVWGEKGRDGTLRYVFFGLPADVAGARYLYGLVELAFETETVAYRNGPGYAAIPSGMRRTASNSFGIGLARGIAAKLQTLRTEREATFQRGAGRDLVVAKASIVEADLEKLGMHFRTTKRTSGRRIIPGAFEQGRAAGLEFEYARGLGQDR